MLTVAEYASFDGLGLAELVSRGEISPKELARTAAEVISALNPDVNAVVETYPDRIDELDESGLGNGPFRGVPYLVKDVTGQFAGRKIEFGSRLCKGMVGEVDTYFGKLLVKAGFNVIGRTNTPEYSMAGTTENALYGNTSTPWRIGYSAGGSSGGAGAAVGSGMVPIAEGSDIAGSIRIPASLCGCIGLKPSRGRISVGPARDEAGFGFASVFCLNKSVRDTAACLDCLCVPQPGDPFVIAGPGQPYSACLDQPVKRLKIGYSTSPLMDAPVDPQVADAVRRTAELLEQLGHDVVEEAPVFDHETASVRLLDLWFIGFDRNLENISRLLQRPIGPETLEPVTLQMYEYAKQITSLRFLESMEYVNTARRTLGEYFIRHDIWLSPTTAQVAEPHGLYHQGLENISAPDYIRHSDRPLQFTFPHNLMGTPAISLPLAMHDTGLPIGVQLGARPAHEHVLLQLASALEDALPWKDRVAPSHASRIESGTI